MANEELQKGAKEYREWKKRQKWKNPDPFVVKTLDEEKPEKGSRVLGLKMNVEEDAELEMFMRLLDIGVDSACVKHLMKIGGKVVLSQIPEETWKYLMSRDRIRYDGRKRR